MSCANLASSHPMNAYNQMKFVKKLKEIIYNCKKRKKWNQYIKETNSFVKEGRYSEGTILEGCNVIRGSDICGSEVGFSTSITGAFLQYSKIGRFCSIASGVHVIPWRHPSKEFISSAACFYNTSNDLPFGTGDAPFVEVLCTKKGYWCEIGNDVWIGTNVLIKGGVTIGDGAIVGMGAVVTKNVPPYAIVCGCPAKIIRYRFEPDTIKKLLSIQWWNWPPETIRERRALFSDPERFLSEVLATTEASPRY